MIRPNDPASGGWVNQAFKGDRGDVEMPLGGRNDVLKGLSA